MSIEAGAAGRAVLDFFDAYMVRRHLADTLACLTEEVHWVGTGKNELALGRAAVERVLRDEFAVEPQGYGYVCEELRERALPGGGVLVLLTARVSLGEDRVNIRVTAALTRQAEGWRIASIHASTANALQGDGEFFPVIRAGGDAADFERRVGAKALDLLGRNIPGGIMGGYLEPGYPLYYVNAQMLEHLGYTREAFERAIGGLVINCMHPDDRERVEREVSAAFAQGREYEVRYRMGKKDGSYFWVNDTGKQGVAEDGRPVCISVIRDISGEREQTRRLEQEAAEKERQARRYDALYQSVLCGIVQYRLGAGGEVSFENANREAIRIFGYTPEEFWAKTDWDLPALIAEEDRARILGDVSGLRNVGDKGSYEYRLRRKDGSSCWIIGSAEIILNVEGHEVVQSVFLDIDGRKRTEQRNRVLAAQVEASNEVLRQALEHTSTCEFYYYPPKRLCVVPERTRRHYRVKARYENMPASFAEAVVGEAYRDAFCAMFERIHAGERTANLEFCTRDGAFCLQETMTVIRSGEHGEPEFVIGIVEDITRQREAERALEDAHSRDSLTGLYNKEAGIRKVQECLGSRSGPDDHCVLMLLDMDDFEQINRGGGSVFADALLQEVADILRGETDGEDVQVRLGGDEFMLLLRHRDKTDAAVIGPRIAEQVRSLLVNADKEIRLSVSVGMCSTQVVDEYNALYRCAESTLKYVKEHGKGQAACYLDTSNELGVFLTQVYTEEHPVNAIDRTPVHREEDLVSFALELLDKSKNLDDAVFLLLSRIGKSLGMDRVSILEADREYLSYRFTYQWARNRAHLELGQDFYVSAQDFDDCAAMYDEEGLCDHNLSDGISRIASCLHAGIWNYGMYVGSMSFEVDVKHYPWTQQQRKLLKELVKIVPSFLMKAKADAVSQAKTEFLSRMSHEIRTPMNAISGMTTIAKSVLDDREKALDCLEKIESANGYLLQLINDILDMSRIESGKLELNSERLDLAEQVGRLESLLRPQAQEKGLELRFENGYRENRPLTGDPLRLNQVLINIIGNAIKFTGRGGSVLVRVEALETSPKALLRFSVRDTGVGIESAALKRIFNAFEQADRDTAARHGGTGLGLAISSRLVQLMGGILEVASRVGMGSEFCFTLPFAYACGDTPQTPQPAPARAPVRDFSGLRLLVAEDNDLNREIVQNILEMNGFTVECVRDGAQAVDAYARRGSGYYDAVLMDIRMPVMDGLEATRRIRTSGRPDARRIPIIALTANAFNEDSRKSLESGMDGHLSKPLQVERLLEVLDRCLDRP